MSNGGKSTFLIILTLLIGASGLGLGVYSSFIQQPLQGPPGQDGVDGVDGTDGIDGKDAPGSILVGIIDPDQNDLLSGIVEIRALIAGSDGYSVSVLRNGTEIGTVVPIEWDTTLISDGWWNITVKATDTLSGNKTQDQVIVYVSNAVEDIPVYYCASQAEINNALANIGSSSGRIIITQDIILTSSIILNGNGKYVLQGIAPTTTIDCGGDRSAIRIEITQSCTVRDLTIDATDVTSSITNIIFVSDTYTHIEDVNIIGDADRRGRGIYVDCSNVWITGCYISEVLYGIYGYTSSDYLHVSDNTVQYCDDGSVGHGIYLGGDHSLCDNNYVTRCQTGIYAYGWYCAVSNNVLFNNLNRGVTVITSYSTFSGNSITGYDPISADLTFGISIDGSSDYNVITGNVIFDYTNSGAGSGTGIRILSTSCEENTVVGNTIHACDTPISDSGLNSYIANNNI